MLKESFRSTNVAPENERLEDEIPFGFRPIFRSELLVSGRVFCWPRKALGRCKVAFRVLWGSVIFSKHIQSPREFTSPKVIHLVFWEVQRLQTNKTTPSGLMMCQAFFRHASSASPICARGGK